MSSNSLFAFNPSARQASLLIGYELESIPPLPPSFLQYYDVNSYTNVAALSASLETLWPLERLSICVSRSSDPSLLLAVLTPAADRCTSITNVEVLIDSRPLELSREFELTNELSRRCSRWLRNWNLPGQKQSFCLSFECPGFRTRTRLLVTMNEPLKTYGVFPSDKFLDTSLTFDNLTYLYLSAPLVPDIGLPNQEHINYALEQNMGGLRELEDLALSCWVHPEVLQRVLMMFARLPHSTSLQVFEWDSLARSRDSMRTAGVFSAIQKGLENIRLRTLILPNNSKRLKNLLQGTLETQEYSGHHVELVEIA